MSKYRSPLSQNRSVSFVGIQGTIDAATAAGGTAPTGNSSPAGVAEIRSGHVHYEAPIAAELISVVATLDPVADGALVIAAQPDFPRKLRVRLIDANSSISAGTLTLVGVGPSGEVVGEVIPLTGGTVTTVTEEAYTFLTSATVADIAGEAMGDTISIGVDVALGLPASQTPVAGSFDVHKANVDNADDDVSMATVDSVAGTIVPTTAPDAMGTYDFWYTYEVSGNIGAHTHTGPSHTHAVTVS
jgi:hypothetical protein